VPVSLGSCEIVTRSSPSRHQILHTKLPLFSSVIDQLDGLYEWCSMTKFTGKASKGDLSAPQKHINSRISYLYQAATYLINNSIGQQRIQTVCANIRKGSTGLNDGHRQGKSVAVYGSESPETNVTSGEVSTLPMSDTVGLPRHLLSHVRAVSRKSQIRLSPTIKQSICKRCDVLLVPGSTSTVRTENRSRGGRKPWADVLVVTCNLCGTTKRFPVGAKRLPQRLQRSNEAGGRLMQDQVAHVDNHGQAQATAEELPGTTP